MILAKWGKRRRSAAVVLAAGLAAATLAAVLATVAAARPLGFLHIRSNLSRTPTLASAYPDLAVSPDGDRVVVVWTEEYYQSGAGSYNHVYLRVASETGAGWGERVGVFSDSSGLSSAYHAAVAVTGPSAYTAHVAYVVFEFDRGYLVQTEVRHKKCSLSLSPVECDASGDVVASVDASFGKIFWVDLALDASGNPHVVWAQYDADWSGDILYRAYDGDGWGATESVEELTGNNHTPSIAWADGYAHVVWGEQTQHQIRYRRRNASRWEPAVDLCTPQTIRLPGNPDIAAGGGRVFVVWDWCSDPQRQSRGYCAQYNLVYGRSNDSGAHWGAVREVGTDRLYAAGGLADYDSAGWYVSGSDVRDEYLQYLRPSIALNEYGWPAVVWHADYSREGDGTDYAIYYSHATTGGDGNVNWVAPDVLNWGQPSLLSSAAVGVGESDGEQQLLHIAYMRKVDGTGAWDVYYDSNEDRDRYEYAYLPLIMNAH